MNKDEIGGNWKQFKGKAKEKWGKLTDDEFDLVKTHPAEGYKLLLEGSGVSEVTKDVCLHHHEKMDGSGYPKGLKGEEIPFGARIAGVADVTEAMLSHRPYRPAWPLEKVVEHFRTMRGRHFDPAITDVFLANLDGFVAIWSKYQDGPQSCP